MSVRYETQKPQPFSVFVDRRDEAIYVLMHGERLCDIVVDPTTGRLTYWFIRTAQTWQWIREFRHGKPIVNLREFGKARKTLSDWEYAARHVGDVAYPVGLYAAPENEVR